MTPERGWGFWWLDLREGVEWAEDFYIPEGSVREGFSLWRGSFFGWCKPRQGLAWCG